MPILFQHILVLAIVAICVAYAGWQGVRALRGKRSAIGSCCATGCSQPKQPSAAAAGPKIVYMPAATLFRNRKPS